MKKRKEALLALGVMLLASSCGKDISAREITSESLQSSLSKIKSDSSTSYLEYLNGVNDYYADEKHKDGTNKKEFYLSPNGGVEYNAAWEEDNFIFSDVVSASQKDYVQLVESNGTITYEMKKTDKTNKWLSGTTGKYTLKLEYYVPESFSSSALMKIRINGKQLFKECDSITLPLLYEDNIEKNPDGSKNFDSYKSKYGDQLYPRQKRYNDCTWQNEDLYETTFQTSDPLVFVFNMNDYGTITSANSTTISLTNASDSPFLVGKLTLVPYEEAKSFNSFLEETKSVCAGTDNIYINATSYTYKNTNEARLSSEQTPSVTPYEAGRKMLNVVYSWESAGQEITYDFDVESSGCYPLTFHYYNSNDNFPSFRTIYVDGKLPYKEFKNYRFDSTGSKYANLTLTNENDWPLLVYLEKGHHTITLQASSEPSKQIYDNLMRVYDSINEVAIKIRKFTGATVDTNRVYDVVGRIPEIPEILKSYETIIYDSYNQIKALIGNDKSSNAISYFQRMIELLDEFIEKPNDIPVNLTKFSSGDSCLGKLVADTASTIMSTPVILDSIYLTHDDSFIPKANASFFSSFRDSLVNLGLTFSSDKYKTELVDGELNIWSGRSQAYNDILQSMADDDFTAKTGVKVNIRQMPSEDNLIYAYAANTVPDLVLGVNSGRAYEFALRGDAAYPMSDFPDYFDVLKKYNIPSGQLMSMLYQDKFYSFPESTSAQLMFTRDDILDVIGESGEPLAIPNTWEELTGQLKRIQARDMNFYYPTSASGSMKSLDNTAQFILQYGGKILTDDAYSINLRDTNTYQALKLLTDLYTINSLPTEVGSFYNSFRYGTLPMGIGDLGMYLSLKYIAPELSGKWSVHLIPGVETTKDLQGNYPDVNVDGTPDEISRWYISNGSSAMIFNNSKMINEAWEFLKWWMSDEIQETYTEALQSTFGPSVIWFSANRNAAASLPIDPSVREVVLEQLDWIIDLQQIPGQYMLMRGLSDIWNTVVFGTSSDGTSTGKVTIANAIDLEKVIVDREIQRKQEEFGFYDTAKGVGKKEYILRDYSWVASCVTNGAIPKN